MLTPLLWWRRGNTAEPDVAVIHVATRNGMGFAAAVLMSIGNLLLGAVVGLLCVGCISACSSELDADCNVDADCRIASSCCVGCVAIHIDETLSSCDLTCFQESCQAEYGVGPNQLSAACVAGKCEVVEP